MTEAFFVVLISAAIGFIMGHQYVIGRLKDAVRSGEKILSINQETGCLRVDRP